MSLPKLSDFMGRELKKIEYKRVSVIHSIKNSFARNTISQNSRPINHSKALQPLSKMNSSQKINHISPDSLFNYEQQISSSFDFTGQDLQKLLGHLFNKKQHDINDRNFIRRLLLKYFPQDIICTAGKDFVNCIAFERLKKNQVKIVNQSQNSNGNRQKTFYLVLKGKVMVVTDQHSFKREHGQYFGQLQILGKKQILQIHAKTDTMLLMMKQTDFLTHFGKYFEQKYLSIRKRVSFIDPILNLVSYYKQLRILELLYEKEYKTGEKIIQKDENITEVVFMNNTDMSFSEDRILNEYKAVGLSQIASKSKQVAKETLYCMQNKEVYAITVDDFNTFIDKETLSNYFSSKNLIHSTLSASKIASSTEDGTLNSQNTCRLQQFVKVKKVKFLGNNSRVLTEPNQSLSSPKKYNLSSKYPEYTASFVFIKENSTSKTPNLKPNRLKQFNLETLKHKELKDYLFKTRNSLKKKRWLDQMETNNEDSIIYNPQKLDNYYSTVKQTKDSGQ